MLFIVGFGFKVSFNMTQEECLSGHRFNYESTDGKSLD